MLKMLKILIILLTILNSNIYASFIFNKYGARASSMGMAYAAVSDDASAPFFNPGGLAQIKQKEAKIMIYYPIIQELSLNTGTASFVYPYKQYGTFSLSWGGMAVWEMYYENSFIFSYGNNFGFLDYGIGLKYLTISYGEDEYTRANPVFIEYGYSQSAFSIDIGILMPVYKAVKAGLSVQNLNQPDIGLKNKSNVWRKYNLGFAGNIYSHTYFNLNPCIQISLRKSIISFHTGIEALMKHLPISLRTGTDYNSFSIGTGYNIMDQYIIDYGFNFPFNIKGAYGSHCIEMTYKF